MGQRAAGPVGRPKSAAKREAIVGAAQTLFLRHGYEQTSTDAVAGLAGVSKATVYGHFPSKQALFAAVIERRRERLQSTLALLDEPTGSPAEDLARFADAVGTVVLDPDVHRWGRLVIAETQRHPELAKILFDSGPRSIHQKLTKYLRSQVDSGRLEIRDAAAAAERFLGSIMGLELLRGLMGTASRSGARRRAAWTHEAVAAFLARYERNS